MKKTTKKLHLSATTVRVLASGQLSAVAGGEGSGYRCTRNFECLPYSFTCPVKTG